MAKMDTYREQQCRDFAHKLFGRCYHQLAPNEQQRCEDLARTACEFPHDLLNQPIKIGNKVVCAVNADRSATLMVGVVVSLHPDKGIGVQEETRTYDDSVNKKTIKAFGFPNRILVIK